MAKTNLINVNNGDTLTAIRTIMKSILELNDIEAILVPRTFGTNTMPVLITDPQLLDTIDPLAPAFVMNAAKLVSKLTHKPIGKKIAVVLRSCEIRALIELIKLKQAGTDDIIIIGIDCLGAFTNKDMSLLAKSDIPGLTQLFCDNVLAGKEPPVKELNISTACRACKNPVPESADILIGLFGMDIKKQLMIKAATEKGEDLFNNLSIPESKKIDQDPSERKDSIDNFIAKKIEFRNEMFTEIKKATDTLEKLSDYFSSCINCYNCRVACPVCYCRECVFNTDVFNHDPYQYIQWAKRKGSVKMPTDTSFYHITRLAHMSLACVGCGQCSNACPNDIPVMELFRYVSDNTQTAFEYEAGKDINQPPPLSVFKEEEYLDVVGIN
jgi:formate dehydrogenase (coenzyme F420) beta subunit